MEDKVKKLVDAATKAQAVFDDIGYEESFLSEALAALEREPSGWTSVYSLPPVCETTALSIPLVIEYINSGERLICLGYYDAMTDTWYENQGRQYSVIIGKITQWCVLSLPTPPAGGNDE